jgi:hypothetical protein
MSSIMGQWPITKATFWCGEWKANPETAAEPLPKQAEEEFAAWKSQLSTRVYNAMSEEPIATFDDLLSTATEIRYGRLVYAVFPKKWRNIGPLALAELEAAVLRTGRTPPGHWQQRSEWVKVVSKTTTEG